MTSTSEKPARSGTAKAPSVYEIDPLRDARWEQFVARHPQASVFHTTSWLTALRETYRYEPMALCTSAPGEPLTSGVVFCRIRSWLTGNRIVSLPFSDHCEVLSDSVEDREALLLSMKHQVDGGSWDYAELRPIAAMREPGSGFAPCHTYARHTIDLSRDCDTLFRSFHKDCVQRKIRRAERESLTYEAGNSEGLLSEFYELFIITRRRHNLPPQPYAWFQRLAAAFGSRLQVRVARHQGRAVASILTLKHGKSVFYKYGCAKARFNHLGGTALLLWRTIQEAKDENLSQFDLGRSDTDNQGLIQFKDRWGASAEVLNYLRFPGPAHPKTKTALGENAAGALLRIAPKWSLIALGRLLYRHVG